MELITVSGAGTLALLVALFADYVVADNPRSAATVDGLASDPGAACPPRRGGPANT
jgi:hypothetical protein